MMFCKQCIAVFIIVPTITIIVYGTICLYTCNVSTYGQIVNSFSTQHNNLTTCNFEIEYVCSKHMYRAIITIFMDKCKQRSVGDFIKVCCYSSNPSKAESGEKTSISVTTAVVLIVISACVLVLYTAYTFTRCLIETYGDSSRRTHPHPYDMPTGHTRVIAPDTTRDIPLRECTVSCHTQDVQLAVGPNNTPVLVENPA